MKFSLAMLILFAWPSLGFSQIEISGHVKNAGGQPLKGATIIVKAPQSDAIISYAVSAKDGKFALNVKSKVEILQLKVSFLGHSSLIKEIRNENQKLELRLDNTAEELDEVVIKTFPIEKLGDTLNFSVSAFKDQRDRSIADVIKKMPGINISSSGQISYFGEPIEKYYIEGLDLLGGNYSLANDNLSADDVSKVQVLENHQSKQVLDSVSSSNRTSLNIKLKRDVAFSGSGKMGLGYEPLLIETKLTPLFFSKTSQALASYEYNNTGKDLSRYMRGSSSSTNTIEGFSANKTDLVSVQGVSRPPFADRRWLDNSDHYGGVNYLRKIKKGTTAKVNLSYLNGVREDFGQQEYTYIVDSDTLRYTENTTKSLFKSALGSQFTYEKNDKKRFFKNKLIANVFWDSQKGTITNPDLQVSQDVSLPYTLVDNNLELIEPIGKQLITFKSKVGYEESNQELVVTPGQFLRTPDSDSLAFQNLQTINDASFFTENTAGFTKKLQQFSIAPKLGFAYKRATLASHFSKIADGQNQESESIINDLAMSSTGLFLTNTLTFETDTWDLHLKTPLIARFLSSRGESLNAEQDIRRINFEPNLRAEHKLTPYLTAGLNGSIINTYGAVEQLFDNSILTNYRSLTSYDAQISEARTYVSRADIKYRNALKAVFARLAFSYSETKRNLIFRTVLNDAGRLTQESLLQDNKAFTERVSLNGSKYFSRLKTTLKLRSSFSRTQNERIFNGDLGRFTTIAQNYTLGVESETTTWLSLNFNSSYSSSRLDADELQFNTVENWENMLSLFFYLNEQQQISLDTEHYNNNTFTNPNTVFMNLGYQYTINQHKVDIGLTWNNIFNEENFVSNYNDAFFSTETTYRVRPSQILVDVRFSF